MNRNPLTTGGERPAIQPGAERRTDRAILGFAVTVFLSAFLLFQVQPLISRYILPWFGGAPAVWSAAMLFFQVVLLGGYAYAHRQAKAPPRNRAHLTLLAVSVLFLLAGGYTWGAPLLPDSFWKPAGASQPLLQVLYILAIGVGLPYFVLSSTSPLLQAWRQRLLPDHPPYGLYALSNIGSLLALVTYPVLVEPYLPLRQQANLWMVGYLVFTGLCAWLALRARQFPAPPAPAVADQAPPEDTVREPRYFPLLWLLLAATTSILLLAITNQLTQEVAVIPFLWVLPLSLYLLSFAITFAGPRGYPRPLILGLLAIAALLLLYAVQKYESMGVVVQIAIYSFFLLAASWACHGELYRLRPNPSRLTAFYFYVSLGGAVGGIFVNLIAPVIFTGLWELYIGALMCLGLVILLVRMDRSSILNKGWAWLPFILIFLGSAYSFGIKIWAGTANLQFVDRNFYGVFRVRQIETGDPPQPAYALSHGITTHGLQFIDPALRNVATSYYGRNSGIGKALEAYRDLPEARSGMQIGIVGLGAGTLAAYGQAGDTLRFYEINPGVIELAEGQGGYFSFLADTPAQVEIIPGDARLSIETELTGRAPPPEPLDLLALDAFSGDAIPVHLLTAEAFDGYLQRLKPGGVLAVHISNRYLDLEPLVYLQAERLGLHSAILTNARDESQGVYTSVWILLSANTAFFDLPGIRQAGQALMPPASALRPWTDDFSNLYQVLRVDASLQVR